MRALFTDVMWIVSMWAVWAVMGCDPVGVDCATPAAGCSGSLVACSSAESVPVTDYMTCWENWNL